MKSAICVFLILSVTIASALEGWRKVVPVKSTTPLLGVIKVEPVSDNGTEAVVRVTNETGESLSYSGYNEKRPQMFFEELRESRWVDTQWDWCGSGTHSYTLEPKHSMLVHIAERPSQQVRACTLFYSIDLKRSVLVQLFGSP